MNAPIRRSPLSPLALLASAAAFLGVASGAAAQIVVAGPFVRPGSSNRYYVLELNNWDAARFFAQGMLGNLVTIEDATENQWIRQTIVTNPNWKYFIGLNDAQVEGTTVWSSGIPATYRNFSGGNGGNSASNDYFIMLSNGTWNAQSINEGTHAIAEISGPVKLPWERNTPESAISTALLAGQSIDVWPGTWNFASTVALNAPLTIRGLNQATAIIQGPVDGPALLGNANLTLENLTFITRDNLAGIDILPVSGDTGVATFRNVTFGSILGRSNAFLVASGAGKTIFEGCTIRDTNALININDPQAQVSLINCVVRDSNSLTSSSENQGRLDATNCTFVRMFASLTANNFPNSVTNSIFAQNQPGFTFGSFTTLADNLSDVALAFPSTNTIVGNPGFVNASGNNFRLSAASLAIDAGNPLRFLAAGPSDLLDADANARIRDALGFANANSKNPIDLGAFEFQGDEGCDDIDFNNDNAFFDPTDIDAFLSVYSEGPCIR